MQQPKIVEKLPANLDNGPFNAVGYKAPDWLNQIVRLEITGTVPYEDESGERFLEQAHSVGERPRFMTLYGRLENGKANALGDYTTVSAALDAAREVEPLIVNDRDVTIAVMRREAFEAVAA
jgi:hypothetical protein